MSRNPHQSVLLHAVCKYLKGKKSIVDCTLGLGGHTNALLEQADDKLKIVAFELDNHNLDYAKKRLEKHESQITYISENFSTLKESLNNAGFEKVDGILLDLGLSSPHIDNGERGFSFQLDGPLDMRFDKTNPLTAEEVVNKWSEDDLRLVIKKYGEEKQVNKIVSEILVQRDKGPIKTTKQLADLIRERAHPRNEKNAVVKVFQALRIAVNDELGVLRRVLPQAIEVLEPGGLLLVISYHSLEDRIVKHFFKSEQSDCVCPMEIPYCQCNKQQTIKIITKKPVEADDNEKCDNPRSRSAKMRVVEKL